MWAAKTLRLEVFLRAGEINPLKAQAYAEEGRLSVLELMGHMVAYYRNYSMGARGNAINKRPKQMRSAEE